MTHIVERQKKGIIMHSYYLAKILYKLQLTSYKDCAIDKTSKAAAQCVLSYVSMDRYSYIGSETHVTSTDIGSFVSIGSCCQIGGGKHPLNMVSTSPVFLEGRNILKKNFSDFKPGETERVVIGNDVWIGDGCYIRVGVRIGDGAIIGVHAVVTRDVEPYSVVAGSPARVIRKRFPEEVVEELMKIAWWNWSDEKIEKYRDYFDDPVRLINALKEDI